MAGAIIIFGSITQNKAGPYKPIAAQQLCLILNQANDCTCKEF
jgi:hypothetical protein